MITITVTGSSAAEARQEMQRLLGEPVEATVATEVKDYDAPPPPADAPAKSKRGRPAKQKDEPVVTETPKAEPEYTDVDPPAAKEEPPKPITSAEVRAACVATADRVGYEAVVALMQDKYGTAVAAEVPAEKYQELLDLLADLK